MGVKYAGAAIGAGVVYDGVGVVTGAGEYTGCAVVAGTEYAGCGLGGKAGTGLSGCGV